MTISPFATKFATYSVISVENIELLDTEKVKNFVGEFKPENYLLKKENPMAVGPYDISAYYIEHKVQQAEAMKAAKKRILEVAAEFEKISGRKYGLIEDYRMEDAEYALVLIGSSAGTAKAAVDMLRAQGKKLELLRLEFSAPFPERSWQRLYLKQRQLQLWINQKVFPPRKDHFSPKQEVLYMI